MIRLINILFLVCIFSFSSCRSSKFLVIPSSGQYLNYDKVKIEVNTKSDDLTFRGYFNMVPDTQICFRLWGLFGYEIGKGIFKQNQFIFYNDINDEKIVDLKDKFQQTSGCVINYPVIENFLTGNYKTFINNLDSLNHGLLDIKQFSKGNKVYVNILHLVNENKLSITYKFRKGRIVQIKLLNNYLNKSTSVVIDINIISYNRKMCNFVL